MRHNSNAESVRHCLRRNRARINLRALYLVTIDRHLCPIRIFAVQFRWTSNVDYLWTNKWQSLVIGIRHFQVRLNVTWIYAMEQSKPQIPQQKIAKALTGMYAFVAPIHMCNSICFPECRNFLHHPFPSISNKFLVPIARQAVDWCARKQNYANQDNSGVNFQRTLPCSRRPIWNNDDWSICLPKGKSMSHLIPIDFGTWFN